LPELKDDDDDDDDDDNDNDDSRLALVGLLKYCVYQALQSVSESGTPR